MIPVYSGYIYSLYILSAYKYQISSKYFLDSNKLHRHQSHGRLQLVNFTT